MILNFLELVGYKECALSEFETLNFLDNPTFQVNLLASLARLRLPRLHLPGFANKVCVLT